jgi:hypothetical protein
MTDVTTLDELQSHGFEPVPEIIWDETTVLRPGLDYRDGTTYFTIPARINIEKTIGSGKKAEKKVVQEDALVVVTSERESFPYTAERVADKGFTYPDTVTLEKDRRWSSASIVEFLKGKATEPDPALLHAGIKKVYEEYIEFARPEYYDVMPMFVMGSYLFRLFSSLGYIHFNGTAASGKSQNLRILDALAFNTVWASSMSPAALYRQLAGMPGVVCIDEAEGFEGERGEELRRILNAGYLDGQKVRRAEKGKNDNFQVVGFESFGPKAIASINPLDYVIGSRCLIVEMAPAIRRIPEFDKDNPRWQRLRDRLYLWAMFHAENIAERVEEWNQETRDTRAPKLIGRQWQITQLYVVLADYIDSFDQGDRCNRLIEFFNEYFVRLQKQQDATDRIRLVLKALPRVLADYTPIDGSYYRLKDIHAVVSSYLEEDAKEYFKTRTLGKHLDVLGFKTKRAHKDGSQVWLDPEVIRHQFAQRRVEPHDEDKDWLAGTTEYTHTVHEDPASLWAEQED